MKVREVMTHPVISLRPRTTVSKAAELLVSHGFSAAPVRTAEGEVMGIATEADLVRDRILTATAESRGGGEHTVAAVMTPAPLCVRPDDDISEVALQMLRTGDRSVLVVDGGCMVGIVTSRDLLRALAGCEAPRRGPAASPASDRPRGARAELLLMRSAEAVSEESQ